MIDCLPDIDGFECLRRLGSGAVFRSGRRDLCWAYPSESDFQIPILDLRVLAWARCCWPRGSAVAGSGLANDNLQARDGPQQD